METNEMFTAKEAADQLGLKDTSKARSLASRCGITLKKFSGRLVYTQPAIDAMKDRLHAEEHGLCPHCGKVIDAEKNQAANLPETPTEPTE